MGKMRGSISLAILVVVVGSFMGGGVSSSPRFTPLQRRRSHHGTPQVVGVFVFFLLQFLLLTYVCHHKPENLKDPV